ncbi:MAG: hypothetical protein P0Y63_04320 [Klebsiella huaxiensis]|uniref:hypothetical protein n=1 Tax=Klebsiella huaxiensis TaxID=2153354 RepID=UPI0026EB2CEE|nr:hypothetical protein [Klebsiella huaxiensis]WEJ90248.1 MAG: hypothetical protein P0Y63_04320 [Klebsiella huaxiensis]
MRQVPFDVLHHAENALSANEDAMAVLNLWLESLPDGDEFKQEACLVSAVMSLLNNGINELVKARDSYTTK